MLRSRKSQFTADEYLAMERVAEYKSEFYGGEIFALAGGTADHSLVAGNLVHALNGLLDAKPCRVFNSDMRLHVRRSGLYTYPDVMVICGKIQFIERRTDTVTNPLLIIEVSSESTRDYDRGAKLDFYKQIPSLQEYALIDSDRARAECYRRAADSGWLIDTVDGLDADLSLQSVACEISMRRIYHKVSWLD